MIICHSIQLNEFWKLFVLRMRLATSRDIDKVMNHFYEDFMPGEPCSRSLGFVKDGKVEAGKVWRSLNKMFLKPMLSGGTSVIAVTEKDEIVGEHT